MQYKRFLPLITASFAFLLILTCATAGLAQGRGRGGGGNPGGGPPAGVGGGQGQGNGLGVTGGLGNASNRSDGRSDDGLGIANDRSNGRSMTGIERAQNAQNVASHTSDTDLNRFRGVSKNLDLTPEQFRAAYQAALLVDPNVTFGQFVSANVVADNLHSRYPNVTADALIAAMATGKSMGQALRSLGVGDNDLSDAAVRTHARITAIGTDPNDLNRFRGLSRHLGTTPDALRAQFEAALLVNPK